MPSILTRPAQTLSGIPGTTVSNLTVAPSITSVVDEFIAEHNYSVKWLVTLVDAVAAKMMVYEITGLNRFNTSTSHNMFGVVGDNIPHTIDVQLVIGNMQLILTNNNVNSLTVSIVRIQTIHP